MMLCLLPLLVFFACMYDITSMHFVSIKCLACFDYQYLIITDQLKWGLVSWEIVLPASLNLREMLNLCFG